MSPVLDASAVLAYLHQETGWEGIQAVVAESCIGAVNWSEVAQKTVQKGLNVKTARALLEEVGLTIAPFSASQAELAAHLWTSTRRNGLSSLADRACLALALEREAPVLTADRAWSKLELEVDIRLVR
ncbi:MAG: type II toxin-antitoxin system VapC family toxin [Pseudomonadota bacterium]|nr:type II toxin-antitoxin system VapC family toxin [Pseudomonadota bacterium]